MAAVIVVCDLKLHKIACFCCEIRAIFWCVCLSTRLLKKFWTDFDDVFRSDQVWSREQWDFVGDPLFWIRVSLFTASFCRNNKMDLGVVLISALQLILSWHHGHIFVVGVFKNGKNIFNEKRKINHKSNGVD